MCVCVSMCLLVFICKGYNSIVLIFFPVRVLYVHMCVDSNLLMNAFKCLCVHMCVRMFMLYHFLYVGSFYVWMCLFGFVCECLHHKTIAIEVRSTCIIQLEIDTVTRMY